MYEEKLLLQSLGLKVEGKYANMFMYT